MVSPKVCFNSNYFLITVTVIIIIMSISVGGLLYFVPKFSEIKEQQPPQQQPPQQQPPPPQQIQTRIVYNRDYDRTYPTSVYIPERTNFSNFKNVGYIFNSSTRLPLYMNRIGDRYYYFTRDDSRNNIKIPVDKNGKYEEYYDGDTKIIPEISTEPFTIKLYEDKTSIYNPFIISV